MDSHRSQEQIDAYLDNELYGADRDEFLAHSSNCETCSALLESRRAFFRVIREARPQFHASDDLRRNIATILESNSPPRRSSFGKWKNRLLSAASFPPIRPSLAYAWLVPILAVSGLLLFTSRRQARADQLVDMAVETHRQQVAHAFPVEFRSSSARDVAHWCSSRLPFAFRLPSYQDESGDRSKYELIGASLVSFRASKAAYIAYRMGNKQISLVVVSADQAVASGGEITKAKSLVFHSTDRDGVQVFTWSVHNLTYALVSDLTLPSRKSCVVCHADPRDRSLQKTVQLNNIFTHVSNRFHTAAAPTLWRLR